ncbi:MAG: single-stranded-DNA-specific exonuclease RecJ, partial [Cyanobacteria bacterium]|nr:single-stranded-DNA-specific exonuclease RecJ [Cyanobacteriota bacterium]
YKLKLNEWQGQRTLQLELVGVRPATAPGADPPQKKSAPAKAAKAATLTLPLTDLSVGNLPLGDSGADVPRASTSQGWGAGGGDRPHRVAEPQGLPPEVDAVDAEGPVDPPSPDDDLAHALGQSLTHLPNGPGDSVGTTSQPVAQVEFYYSRRRYTAQIFGSAAQRELYIYNPEGQTLAVMLPERQGYLCLPGQDPRPVAVGEAHYFNLIRAGMAALELQQQTRLLWEKDELLAEKDRHIAALTQQVQLLEEKLHQLSQEQQQQFQTLRQEIQTQASAIQTQEAHIATMQDQQIAPAPPVDPKALKQAVRSRLGDALWFCLQAQSQTDLYTAHKQAELIAHSSPAAHRADYSTAAQPLIAVVQREVLDPFFQDLHSYCLAAEAALQIGTVQLGAGPYSLGVLPPLLSDRWQSLRAKALQASAPAPDAALYCTGRSRQPLTAGDRDRLTTFLNQWEHPMAPWLQADPAAAASLLDQIHRVSTLANTPTDILQRWVFELLDTRIMGEAGLLRHVYGAG